MLFCLPYTAKCRVVSYSHLYAFQNSVQVRPDQHFEFAASSVLQEELVPLQEQPLPFRDVHQVEAHGFDLLQALHCFFPHCPILLVSARVDVIRLISSRISMPKIS